MKQRGNFMGVSSLSAVPSSAAKFANHAGREARFCLICPTFQGHFIYFPKMNENWKRDINADQSIK